MHEHDGALARLEMPGAKVNLTTVKQADGSAAYPPATAPTGTGGESLGELTAINRDQFLLIERDSAGDGLPAPRFKKIFLIDAAKANGGYVSKQLLVELMAAPDPRQVGGDGDFFRFPFNTIESVLLVSSTQLLVIDDNNYPFSNGRSRSTTNERTGPLAPDDNQIILVQLGEAPDARAQVRAVMELGLQGRVAVVTGAGRGIGLAISTRWWAEGVHVVAGSLHTSADLEAMAAEGSVEVLAVDLTEPSAMFTIDPRPPAFSKARSKEVGGRGIRVNTVSPGPVATALWLGEAGVAETVGRAAGLKPEEVADRAAHQSFTGRFTQPSEVADLVVLLASDRTANVTGADFTIDGGLITTI